MFLIKYLNLSFFNQKIVITTILTLNKALLRLNVLNLTLISEALLLPLEEKEMTMWKMLRSNNQRKMLQHMIDDILPGQGVEKGEGTEDAISVVNSKFHHQQLKQ